MTGVQTCALPISGKGLFAICLFIDKAENEFPLASAVASVDNLGNVAAVHKVFEDRKLLLFAAGNGKLPLLRDNGEIVILPFAVLLVIGRRVCKANQMPDTPRYKVAVALKISAALFIRAHNGGNRRPDARFFCNYKVSVNTPRDEYGFAKGKSKRYFRVGFGKWLTERAFVKKYFSEE